MIKIYSFDIFDTCITRTFFRPTDLFYQLFKNSNPNLTPEDIYDLVRLRIKAESEARSLSQKEDITIQDIYDRLDIAYYDLEPQTVKQTELDLEFQSLRPIREIQIKIESLRQQGHKIIFISDMYLPTEHIQKILIHNQIAQSNDPIYVSGDIGLTKATGNLFRYILKQEKITVQQLYHTGDNHLSDVLVPQKLGIHALYFRGTRPNRYEQVFRPELSDQPDFTYKLIGLSRAIRLSHSNGNSTNSIARIAANVVAPLMLSYVAWVLQKANDLGIQRLYFVARDGQILLKIAKILSQNMPAPDCRYLYGSRQAWFFPSLSETTNLENLDWLIIKGHSRTPRHLLAKLYLTPETIADVLVENGLEATSWDKPLAPEQLDTFWKVLKHSDSQKQLQSQIQVSRALTRRYLEQEGLQEQKRWSLVDMGWTLKTQRTLSNLLDRPVEGFYFGLLNVALTTSEAGRYHAFLMESPYSSRLRRKGTDYLFQYMKILEQVFTAADHGSTLSYQEQNGRVQPNLKDTRPLDPAIATLQQIILNYTENFIQQADLHSHLPDLKRYALSNAVQYFSKPEVQDVQAIAHLHLGDDQNDSNLRPIARPLKPSDFIYYLKKLLKMPMTQHHYIDSFEWHEGAIELSPTWLKIGIKQALKLTTT